ncbi:MAG TPA: methionyl-tRNA formyltransferase [Candidatus Woesebacteria bacterium]|nr:methionyl-tRNA formyltransferase [Candidatus Woesebacteria bacterium]
MKPNLIFFGSPEFSAVILESVIKSNLVNVVGVVTTPDKPTGRNLTLSPSPVAVLADSYNLPVYKPGKLDDDNLAHLKILKPDIFLVVSFGKIIPQSFLDTPKIGTYNIHFSLLPKYRGALCISQAIKNQDQETGVTLMEMDALLDHGPIIAQSKIAIDIDDDIATLTTKLTQAAIILLANKLPEICAQNYSKTTQDETKVVFTPSHKTVTRQTAFIPYEKILVAQNGINSQEIHALVRSLNPDPGAWTTIQNQDVKILKTLLVDGKLVLDTIQLPGKSPISWKQFLQGHPL